MSDFSFDGKPILNSGDVLDASIKAAREGKAKDFFIAYQNLNEFARPNIACMLGYCDADTRNEILSIYGPVFREYGNGH